MVKILITGANSFVGTNFKKFSQYDKIDEISLLEFQPEIINFEKYDVVLHVAAIVHSKKSFSEEEYFRVNRDLCLRVAENAKDSRIRHFIFMSTVKVYAGSNDTGLLRNEAADCTPDDAYGKSKLAAELELKRLEDSNFTVSIIRTPLVYGYGVKGNMMSLIKLVKYIPILPLGNISNKRNVTYIENLVGYIDQIIEKRASGVFLTMDENPVSTTELVSYLSTSLKRKTLLFKLPQFAIRIGYALFPGTIESLFGSLEFDNSITKDKLDFVPPFSTEEGICKMVESYKSEEEALESNELLFS